MVGCEGAPQPRPMQRERGRGEKASRGGSWGDESQGRSRQCKGEEEGTQHSGTQ